MSKQNIDKKMSDEEVRKLVVARLSVLSPDMYIAVGSDGSFSRDELIQRVEANDEIGKEIADIQLEWLRSWKQRLA
ncbi:TPA: hypothetical protein DDZ10_00055 [Candidatus Uhrbacteria bacterium]|nr:hypothetical protein [Candidatus Uhrbacteria bacterium]